MDEWMEYIRINMPCKEKYKKIQKNTKIKKNEKRKTEKERSEQLTKVTR